jgi:DNA-binding NarL/FixJ family response regulator
VLEEEHQPEKQPLNSNETAKREMATELLLQGFSEKAICRILNISPDQMPE